jgi:hypothetical protein
LWKNQKANKYQHLRKSKALLQTTPYNALNDIVLIGDLGYQTLSLVSAKGIITLELGKWR